jgi:carbon-monoxide dehydrogenase medium subunit
MRRFDYHRPRRLKEALDLMDRLEGRARYIAGGTDILVRMKQGLLRPEALISLRGIPELRGMKANGGLWVGSGTPFREIERDPSIRGQYPALAEAAGWLANPQIRNVATVGGNLANAAPSADSAPPLIVLGVMLTVEGPGGGRQVAIDDFFRGPGKTCLDPTEILTGVLLPRRTERTGTAFCKIGRTRQDIAVVNAAAFVEMEGRVFKRCRLCVGAVAPVPLRLLRAEAMLEGRAMDEDLLGQVASVVREEVSPITDVRSSEAYRRHVSGVLVKRAIRQAAAVAKS